MQKPPTVIVDLLQAGATVIIRGSDYPPQSLVDFAMTAAGRGTSLHLTHVNHLAPTVLAKIAMAGQGRVILDLRGSDQE